LRKKRISVRKFRSQKLVASKRAKQRQNLRRVLSQKVHVVLRKNRKQQKNPKDVVSKKAVASTHAAVFPFRPRILTPSYSQTFHCPALAANTQISKKDSLRFVAAFRPVTPVIHGAHLAKSDFLMPFGASFSIDL
jgi:hypothetical protein